MKREGGREDQIRGEEGIGHVKRRERMMGQRKGEKQRLIKRRKRRNIQKIMRKTDGGRGGRGGR